MRRNNDELLANWGNLVNRTLTNAHRNFGAVPQPGELDDATRRSSPASTAGFDAVGDAHRGRAGSAPRSARRCGSPRRVNQYVSDQAPWALVKTDRDRAATVLYVSLRAVDSLKTMFTPFLPHTSQQRARAARLRGFHRRPARVPRGRRGGRQTHEVLTGDYACWIGSWEPSDLPPGQALLEPRPLFRKLDDSVVEEELARMRAADAA